MRRKSNQEDLGQVIERLLDVYRLRSGLTEISIRSSWAEIAGPAIAQRTQEIMIRGDKLIVKVNSAALKQELIHQREALCENVNRHFNKKLIREVQIW
ncbi:MAG: DUF721 domain-containing protein [Salibacteraceae bacterium]